MSPRCLILNTVNCISTIHVMDIRWIFDTDTVSCRCIIDAVYIIMATHVFNICARESTISTTGR